MATGSKMYASPSLSYFRRFRISAYPSCRTRFEGCPHQMGRHIRVHAGAVPNQDPSIVEREHCDTIRTSAITPIQSWRLQNRWKSCPLEGTSDNIVLYRMTGEATITVSTGQWVVSLLVNIAATSTPMSLTNFSPSALRQCLS